MCQCVKSIWAVRLSMSPPFSKCSIYLSLRNTFTPHSFMLSCARDLGDMQFTCSLRFISNINHYAELNPCVPRPHWQLPWGQYCPWEQLSTTECPAHGREGDVSCEQPHLLSQPLLCPGILVAETWEDPGRTLLPSMPPRVDSAFLARSR